MSVLLGHDVFVMQESGKARHPEGASGQRETLGLGTVKAAAAKSATAAIAQAIGRCIDLVPHPQEVRRLEVLSESILWKIRRDSSRRHGREKREERRRRRLLESRHQEGSLRGTYNART